MRPLESSIRALTVVGCVLSSGAGCSGDDGDETTGLGAKPCAAYASAHCRRLEACAPHALVLGFDTRALCAEAVEARCERDRADGFGVADLAGCVGMLDAGDCQAFLAEDTGKCARNPGPVAGGAPCRQNEQCQSGVCRFSGNVCGTCLDALDEGEPCGGVAEESCKPGLVCDDTGTGNCVALQTRGDAESCDAAEVACEAGLYCEPTLATCTPWLTENAACSAAALCDSRRGLFCNEGSGTCGKLDVLVENGEACGTDGVFPRCSERHYCDPADRICVRRKQAGESCNDDPVAGSTCDVELVCSGGTCVTYEELCLSG
jgi:hypothetical protein